MSLCIRKIIRPRLNEEPREYLAEGFADAPAGRTETLLIINAPKRLKNRFVELFSSPVDKKLVALSSEIAQQVTTGMSAVFFTQLRPPTDQIIIERFLNVITAKLGKPERRGAYADAILVFFFVAYLIFAYFYERLDDSRLGIWKFVSIPIIVYVFYRMKNSFCGLRIYSRFKEDTKERINVTNHPLTDLPWHKISQLGSTLFAGRFPYKVTLEELLQNQMGFLSRLKLFLKIPLRRKTTLMTGCFASAKKTMLTIHPAIIDSHKNVLAVIAIPDSYPESGILILPEPKDMELAMAQILNICEPKCEVEPEQEQEKQPIPVPEQVDTPEQPDLNDILTKNFQQLDDQASNKVQLELDRVISENDDLSNDFQGKLGGVLRIFTDDPDLYRMYMLNQNGLTLEQIGDKIGCSASKVSRKLSV